MNAHRSRLVLLAASLLGIVTLVSCREQTPVRVFVTPTPGAAQPIAASQPTQPPTAAPSDTPESSATRQPRATREPSATRTPRPTRQPTNTATLPPTLPPDATFGAIVGPDHTLIPTDTRVPPTVAPTVPPTAGPSPTPMPGLESDLMGIQVHPHIDSREFDMVLGHVGNLGLRWIKFQLYWGLLEKAPGQYTELFHMETAYIQRAHAQGFKVMISIAKAPGWARYHGPDRLLYEDGPPDDPAVLASSLSGMLNMIGYDAAGRPNVDAVEVWNEPNLQREWEHHPLTGEEYMRYFGPAYDAVRAFSPQIVVITAAPAPTGDSHWSTNDRAWLQGLYNAGLAGYGTSVAVGIHPYAWANPPDARCCSNPSRGWDDQRQFFFLDTIQDYRDIMLANGHGDALLWATEFGWATFDGLRTGDGTGPQPPDPADAPYFSFIDQWQQADYTVRAFQLGQEIPYMGPMILWNLNFSAIGGAIDRSNPQAGYGLLDGQWQPRPVYTTLMLAPKY